MASICRLCRILWIYVEILQQDSLREGGFVMYSRTTISMPTGSDLEIEGAVYSEIKETC